MNKMVIGSPALTGETAKELVEKFAEGAKFPMDVVFTNNTPRSIALRDGKFNVFLHACLDAFGVSVAVSIADIGQLHRVAASVEAIAAMNKYREAVSISTVEEEAAQPVTDGAGTESNGDRDEVKTPESTGEQPNAPQANEKISGKRGGKKGAPE